MTMGRPTKYKVELNELIVAYFLFETKEGRLPFLSKFAREVAGVCENTMIEWTKEYEDFNEAYKKAKDIQKEFLIMQGLTGQYDRTFAIFTAKNITDMRDKTEVDQNSNVHVTGLEKLNEEQLDALISKLKTTVSQSVGGEGEKDIAKSAEVRQATP